MNQLDLFGLGTPAPEPTPKKKGKQQARGKGSKAEGASGGEKYKLTVPAQDIFGVSSVEESKAEEAPVAAIENEVVDQPETEVINPELVIEAVHQPVVDDFLTEAGGNDEAINIELTTEVIVDSGNLAERQDAGENEPEGAIVSEVEIANAENDVIETTAEGIGTTDFGDLFSTEESSEADIVPLSEDTEVAKQPKIFFEEGTEESGEKLIGEHYEPRIDDVDAFENFDSNVKSDSEFNSFQVGVQEETAEIEDETEPAITLDEIELPEVGEVVNNIGAEVNSATNEAAFEEERNGLVVPATEISIPEIHTEVISQVIYSDGKIGVKVKPKKLAAVKPVEELKELSEKIKIKKLPQKRGRKSFKEIDAEVDLVEIPGDEELFKKQYYPISTVAKWFRVNTSLLRFWENEFDILKPRKNRKGDRMFRPEDVKNLVLIYHLLRHKKFTIDGAKEFIKSNKKKADTQLQLTQTLQKFKSFLLELKANLQT